VDTLMVGDDVKRAGLARMKAVATGCLLLATVVYAISGWRVHLGAPAWVDYVRAAAEAGMVGALADWFAVTALFRRPLGLPIPHTAIIPTRKNQLGDSLGEFVGANFLSERVVRDKLRGTRVAERVGRWLARPEGADRATVELSTALRGALTVLNDDDVQQLIEQVVIRRFVDQPWGPPLGTLLGHLLEDRAHHKLVDLVCDRAYEWVRDNEEVVMRVVTQRAPAWSPRFFDQFVSDKVYTELVNFAWSVKTDPEHQMRAAVDRFLIEFAHDLRDDPPTIARAEQIKQQVLNHPEVKNLVGSAWSTAKRMILEAAADPDSPLRAKVREALLQFGDRLATDVGLRAKVDNWLENVAAYVVDNYRAEITTLITDTVARWDAEETSRKIELQVGRDLQYIRINGTVVGALAGLAIHAVSRLLW
jgi:uncharacterized membrane-anchored protein YjiN (DUF445 family)